MHPIFVQAFFYGIVMILSMLFLGFLMKGFMWKYLKVKLSFGKLVLVKLRAINQDFYSIGRVEGGFLLFKAHKDDRRIEVNQRGAFYKSIGVTWIDVDDEKNCVINPDTSISEGFDATKFENLYKRCLYAPKVTDKREQIIMVCCIISVVAIVVLTLIIFNQSKQLNTIQTLLSATKSATEQAIQRAAI